MFRDFLKLGAGDVVSRGLHAVALLVLARTAGDQAFGAYGVAAAFVSYGMLAVQFGFETIASREGARDPDALAGVAARLCGLRIILAIGVSLATVLFARGDAILIVFCGSFFAQALNTRWALIVTGRAGLAGRAPVIAGAVFLAGCATGDPLIAAAAQAGGELLAALIQFRAVPGRIAWDAAESKRLFGESWPIAVSLVLGNMMFNFDVLYLKGSGREAQVGLYLAAYRCLTIFGSVLASFQQALLPDVSRTRERAGVLARVTQLGAGMFAVLLIPAAIFAFWPGIVLRVLYGGSYEAAAPMLSTLAWALPLQGARGAIRQALYAYGAQRTDTANLAVAVVTNVVLDITLVPRFGALGCAYSTVAAEAVLAVATWTAVRREARR